MKTSAIAILAALFLSAAFAEDAKPTPAAEGAKPTVSRHLTPEQRRARQAQMMMVIWKKTATDMRKIFLFVI